MRQQLFGRSGLKVSELALGTMTFGEASGFGADKGECRRIFDAYVSAGGNFIDTANFYTLGTSEEWVGEFVRGARDRFVIATKYTMSMDAKDPNAGGNARKNLHRSLEASLRRLGTDYVDLYWVHAWDRVTPVEELLRALDDAVRAGKILYTGFSNVPAWYVSRAQTMAELRGWTPFVGLQLQYSLVERHIERELLPCAAALGMTVAAWSPLAGGLLSGKYSADATQRASQPGRLTTTHWGQRFISDRNFAIATAVADAARRLGCTSAQVAIAWLLQHPQRIVPIVGARSAAQTQDLLGATDVTLDAAALASLEAATRIEPCYPETVSGSPSGMRMVHGDFGREITGIG